jgi:hypothetical protein
MIESSVHNEFQILDLYLETDKEGKDAFRSGGLHFGVARDLGEMVGDSMLEP